MSATDLIAAADRLGVDAHNLREIADRYDAISVRLRELGFLMLVNEPKSDTDERTI
jgi:hypothetical protein